MPKDFIYETAITIDHELNELRLDTTVTSVATSALRCGYTEVTTETSKPYRRFTAQADQARLRRPKGQRGHRGAAGKRSSKKQA